MFRQTAACLLLGAAACVPACSRGVHGVQVHNQTDRLVRVELIQLNRAGEMSVYSTQTLTAGPLRVAGPERGFPSPRSTGEEAKRRMVARARVLVVEDDPDGCQPD